MAKEKMLSSEKRTAADNDLHPMVGMFTRSKSRIYLHRNRSDRARFDSLPQSLSKKRRRIVLEEDSSNKACDELSRFSIKDLRTRRVFSNGFGLATPKPTVNEAEKGIGRIESGFWINSCLKPRKYEEVDVSNGSGGLVEECVQSTPPDIDLLVDTKVVEQNGNPNVEFVTKKQSNELNQKNSKIRSLLRPCSRVKLFKAPGSFSYRRLLPYLMDISGENSCGQKMGPEEKALSTTHGQEFLINKSTKEIGYTKSNNLDSGNQLNSTSIECIKEPSMSRQFSYASISMVDEWSKPIVNGGIEKFNFKNNSVRVGSVDLKLMNTEETEIGDLGNPEIVNNLSSSESLLLEEKCNLDGQCFEATKPSETEGVCISDVGGSTEVSNIKHANSSLSDGERHENLTNAKCKDNDNGEVLDLIDNLNKEYAPRTQPDDDFFGKPEVAENGGNGKCMHNIPSKPLIGSRYRNNNSVNDRTFHSSPRRKLVMSGCSRLKLFRTPGSVSYRRMLPFLIKIEEDNSRASGKGHVLKFEKKLEARTPLPSPVSDYQETPLGNAIGNDCRADRSNDHNNALQISTTAAFSNYQETSLELFKHFNESPNQLRKLHEHDVHFEQGILDKGGKLDGCPEIMDINHESNLPDTPLCSSGSFPRKDDKQTSSPASSSSSEEDCNNPAVEVTNNAKSIEADSVHQKSSLHATSFCLNIPAPVFSKGILKRTPRGCRGLCTCLNCSSFRLHAEKAFEFSRNQMQDAEELASDLITELSYIRNMLEKSPFSADGHALVSANQVKEACRRVSEAEEVAQKRLSEMNFDLNIHCRLTCTERPRVKFANYVEEKVITKSDLSNKHLFN